MGRSPALSTRRRTVSRPPLSSMLPSATSTSPGTMALPDRIVDRDELGPVRERPLHLHLADHLRDALQDVGPGEHLGAPVHELGHRLPLADPLEHLRRN